MESAPFGQGKLGVHQALATQQSKVKDIMKFKGNLEQVLQSEVSRTQDSYKLLI